LSLGLDEVFIAFKDFNEFLICRGTRTFIFVSAIIGALSYYVGLAIIEKKLKNCTIVLVDRTSPRHKQDNKLLESDVKIERIRADIKDLVVGEIPAVLSESTKNVVGMSKHLCGAALGITNYYYRYQIALLLLT
jgi:hypothetical protein